MRVVLGGMELRTTEKPDSVQHGGGQMLAVNTFQGEMSAYKILALHIEKLAGKAGLKALTLWKECTK